MYAFLKRNNSFLILEGATDPFFGAFNGKNGKSMQVTFAIRFYINTNIRSSKEVININLAVLLGRVSRKLDNSGTRSKFYARIDSRILQTTRGTNKQLTSRKKPIKTREKLGMRTGRTPEILSGIMGRKGYATGRKPYTFFQRVPTYQKKKFPRYGT